MRNITVGCTNDLDIAYANIACTCLVGKTLFFVLETSGRGQTYCFNCRKVSELGSKINVVPAKMLPAQANRVTGIGNIMIPQRFFLFDQGLIVFSHEYWRQRNYQNYTSSPSLDDIPEIICSSSFSKILVTPANIFLKCF